MANGWRIIIYIILIPTLLDNAVSKLLTHTANDHEISVIKKILLEKLGMKSEPHANVNDIPKPIIDHIQSKQLIRKVEYTLNKLTVSAVNAGKNILEFKFNKTDLIGKHDFSAILNLNIDHEANDVIKVSRNGKIIARITNGEENWVTKNITNDIVKWLKKRRSKKLPKYILKISGTEISFDNKAYIDIKYNEVVKKRNKRNNECVDSNENCCRRKIIVTTAELQWDGWFYSPKEFPYYFCAGNCYNQPESLYAKIVGGVSNKTSPGCCVPTKLQGLRVMYVNAEKTLFDKEVENFMAEDCMCAGADGQVFDMPDE